jgi:uncharacterized protein YukE
MAFEGMDPDQVDSLGRQLQGQQTALQGIITTLDHLASSMATNWVGADSSRFQQTWTGQYRTQLNQAASQLGTLAHQAISNAGQQRQTSA